MIILLPVLLVLHILLLSRLTFTAWPEMLSYPYLFVNGFSLYKDYIMPYPPGLVFLLSGVFQTFGFSVEVLKVLTWSLILIEDVLLYLILRKVLGRIGHVSLIFVGVFILLQSFLDGNMLWFDFAMVIPLLISFWFGLKWLENFKLRELFLMGIFLGIAILIKQTAGIYLLGLGIFIWGIRGIGGIREIGVIGVGVLTLVALLPSYLLTENSLTSFWNWALLYPLTEWSKFPGYVNFLVTPKYILITLLLLAPLSGIFFNFTKLIKDRIFILSLIFLIAALIAVYPRFSFFHLQPATAFAVLLFARIFSQTQKDLKVFYLGGIFIICVVISALLYKSQIGNGIRFYSDNDKRISQAIIANTNEGERVYLLGLNSSQYVFTKRLPPRNWSDNFGWYLEIPGVQEWTIEGLKKNPPEKVFWKIPSEGEWYDLGSYQPKEITNFIRQNYLLTGKIEEGIEIWTRNEPSPN